MAKAKKEIFHLQCTVCNNSNYTGRKSSGLREAKEKFTLMKFCRHCRKQTEHKERKK
ncbi:50S ribosomal protein L33 [Candidatus Berkelbacteria bacterium]|nr:50S ribosomal protein L33 [Candidatus Berkelbacteria bacterium]